MHLRSVSLCGGLGSCSYSEHEGSGADDEATGGLQTYKICETGCFHAKLR